MAKTIEMPKLSDTMTSGTLVKWLKKEGDSVASGDILAEVETDKATMELEAFDNGVLLKHFVAAGADVQVGAPICAIGAKGEKVDAPSGGAQQGAKDGEPLPKEAKQTEATPPSADVSAAPQATHSAHEEKSTAGNEEVDSRIKSSPLARKIAADKGISIKGLTGTGPAGRIVKADVIAAGQAAPASTGGTVDKAASSTTVTILSGKPIAEDADLPVSKMRSVIAQRLLESKTQIPHFYLEVEVDAEPLIQLRAQINNALADVDPARGGIKLSVNDLILKACAEALRRVPAVNTSWQGNSVRQHGSVHLSFAVSIDDGLVTPVIRDCHLKSVRDISFEAKSLAKKARDRKLTPNEMTGGTFCISNMGMLGIDRFCAIINPPNTAILAVGSTVQKPVVKDGQIVIGQRMSLTLSADHRVVDGAVAASFLTALKSILENPATILV
jgi:pyruvate dehydrogenase E2 component (dihydrolipoamide acetyltransferase)